MVGPPVDRSCLKTEDQPVRYFELSREKNLVDFRKGKGVRDQTALGTVWSILFDDNTSINQIGW